MTFGRNVILEVRIARYLINCGECEMRAAKFYLTGRHRLRFAAWLKPASGGWRSYDATPEAHFDVPESSIRSAA